MSKTIKELENTISLLELQLNAEKEKVKNLQEHIETSSEKTQFMISNFKTFCTSILEKDIASGDIDALSIKGMSLLQMLNAAELTYKKEQKENQDLLVRFGKKIEEKNQKIYSLKLQVSQLIEKVCTLTNGEQLPDPNNQADCQRSVASMNVTGEEIDYRGINNTDEISLAVDGDDFADALIRESSKDQTSSAVKEKQTSDNSPDISDKYEMVDMEKNIAGMNDIMWECLRVIGNYGFSDQKAIFTQIINDCSAEKKPSDAIVYQNLNNLVSKLFLEKEKIMTGIRTLNVFKLSDMGERVYIRKYKKKPKMSDIDVLKKEHDNFQHGYLIREAASLLSAKGIYSSICTSRKANAMHINARRYSVPDIVAIKGTDKYLFEVECGNHTQADFNDKCDKLTMLTEELYFIVQNNEIAKKLKQQIEKWIEKRGGVEVLKKAHVVVYLTTMTGLRDDKWIYVYNMKTPEPMINTEMETIIKQEVDKSE